MTTGPVKLIASDLDGTLLGLEGRVTHRTAAALEAVAAAGVEVVIATGRSHWTALPLVGHLGCIRWVICSNGATVYDRRLGDVVVRRPLADPTVALVVERLEAAFPTVGLAWESPEGVVQSPQWLANRAATNPSFAPSRHEPATELRIGATPILKLLVAHDHLAAYDWLAAVEPHLPAGVSVSTSGASFVEITAPEATKGEALRQLCLQLGVEQASTVAFGDHANDLGMLAWAGVGYAMANAAPPVRAGADEVAPNHAHDGVAVVVERLLRERVPPAV